MAIAPRKLYTIDRDKPIEAVLTGGPRTRDMGGTANTSDVGKAIADAV